MQATKKISIKKITTIMNEISSKRVEREGVITRVESALCESVGRRLTTLKSVFE